MQDEDSQRRMQMICAAAEDFKARDILVLDVREQVPLTDFFVICSGTSATHIQSIAEGVRERMREQEGLRAQPEGGAGSFWIVLDYGDVVLHVFDAQTREFYDLEHLWADAKTIAWPGAQGG